MVHKLVKRIGLGFLLRRFPVRLVMALFVFVGGFLTIGILSGVAMISGTPFVFPSLGPSAFEFFFHPTSPSACPRNAIYGHAIGILCGFGGLWLMGLVDAPSAMQEGIGWRRVLAVALSLAGTGALMILLDVTHPPAAATTLIISLGIIRKPYHLLTIEVAVVLLTILAIGINRLAEVDYPLWAPRRSPPE